MSAVPPTTAAPPAVRRSVHDISPGELRDHAAGLIADGHRLALVSAGEAPPRGLRVTYLFTAARPDRRAELRLHLPPSGAAVPSLAGICYPAGRFERELRDLYGITPEDHPLPRRLVRHHHWPRGWHPMLDAAGPPPVFGDHGGPYPFLTVEGPGTHEVPPCPAPVGLTQPGHFRLSVAGGAVRRLRARLWFLHKGVEKQFHGRRPADGLALAERVSGDTSAGHALAYCLAVEEATGTDVAPRAQRARAVLLELERLYNHVGDLGALCAGVAHGVLDGHAGRLRERLLRINAEVTGHRLLRGGVLPGGAALRAVPDPGELAAIGAEAGEIARLALGHAVVADRFTGTAVLPPRAARDLGTLGYVGRASGLAADARLDHPFTDVGPLDVATRTTGDVLARFQVRADEITSSVRLVGRLAGELRPGVVRVPLRRSGPASGTGIAEGWRGTIVHRVELGPDGALTRVKIADPSFFNWPALPVALTDATVADFPLASRSFNLSYAGNDL